MYDIDYMLTVIVPAWNEWRLFPKSPWYMTYNKLIIKDIFDSRVIKDICAIIITSYGIALLIVYKRLES